MLTDSNSERVPRGTTVRGVTPRVGAIQIHQTVAHTAASSRKDSPARQPPTSDRLAGAAFSRVRPVKSCSMRWLTDLIEPRLKLQKLHQQPVEKGAVPFRR